MKNFIYLLVFLSVSCNNKNASNSSQIDFKYKYDSIKIKYDSIEKKSISSNKIINNDFTVDFFNNYSVDQNDDKSYRKNDKTIFYFNEKTKKGEININSEIIQITKFKEIDDFAVFKGEDIYIFTTKETGDFSESGDCFYGNCDIEIIYKNISKKINSVDITYCPSYQ